MTRLSVEQGAVCADGTAARGVGGERLYRRALASWLVLMVIVSVMFGVAVGMILVPPPTPPDLAAASRPTSAPVGTQKFDDNSAIDVVFSVGNATPLIARATGVVTTASQPHDKLDSGRAAFSVDLRPIVALHTVTPLFRDLALGDHGKDVAALNAELTRLGYGKLGTDRFSSQTATAWAKVLRDCGADSVPKGLRLADVLWLPAASVTLESWSATPGTSIEVNEPVGSVGPKLFGANLRPRAGQMVMKGKHALKLFGISTTIDDLSAPLSEDFLHGVEASSGYAQVLRAGAPYETSADMSLVTPIDVLRVPPAAVFAVEGRHACIQARPGALPVTIVGSGLGATLIVPDSAVSVTEVLLGDGITFAGC